MFSFLRKKKIHPGIKEFGERLVKDPQTFTNSGKSIFDHNLTCNKTGVKIYFDNGRVPNVLGELRTPHITGDEKAFLSKCAGKYCKWYRTSYLSEDRKELIKKLTAHIVENK